MMVVKIGGSLLPSMPKVMHVFMDYEVLLVPGGGVFADAVRKVYGRYQVSEEAIHDMAVLATHQYGLFLSDISGIPTITSLEDFKERAIILPMNIVANSDLKPSWNVTSDTIACYIARLAGEKKFIKLTDVDGVILDGMVVKRIRAGKLLNTTTCVDKSLPSCLQTWKMDCRVVNGKKENNIRKALMGKSVGTLITGGK